MRFDPTYQNILVGKKDCKKCGAQNHYDPLKSSSRSKEPIVKVGKTFSQKTQSFGGLKVQYYEDKVCVNEEDNCIDDFVFTTVVTGTSTLDRAGGVIGMSPVGDLTIL